MKRKFFSITWEGDYNLDERDIKLALTEIILGKAEVHEINTSMFDREEDDTDCCSITKKHNYQPSICVHCGKQKPKKLRKWDYDEFIDNLIDRSYNSALLKLYHMQEQIIDEINETDKTRNGGR